MKKKTKKKSSTISKISKLASIVEPFISSKKNPIRQEIIPSMAEFKARVKAKQRSVGGKNLYPMPYKVPKAKTGKAFGPPPKKGPTPQGLYKLDKPGKAYTEAAKLIKSKKYPFINRAVDAKTKPTKNNETMRTATTDKEIYPTVQMKKGKLQPIKKRAYDRAKERGNVAPLPKTVSAGDMSKALSNLVGQVRKNKVSQKALGLKIGALSNLGCPHRENGVQGSDIKGIKPIQVKGKGFTGMK